MKIDSGVNIPSGSKNHTTPAYYNSPNFGCVNVLLVMCYFWPFHHIVLYRVQLAMSGIWTHNIVVIGVDCIDNYKSNYLHRFDVLGYWRIADIYCLFKVKVSFQFIYLYSNLLDDTINSRYIAL